MTEGDPTVQEPSPPTAATEPPAFKDRKAGLLVFGILLLLIALASLGSAGLQLVVLFAGDQLDPSMIGDTSLYVFSAVFYVVIAAATAWLGVGSIQ